MKLSNNEMNNGYILKLSLFIIIAGLGLRIPISYIPPMSLEIMDDLKINHSTLGLITSLSPLCFFIFSPLTPYFERKIGLYKTLIMTFIVAIFAYFLRLNGSVILLLVSTIMFGFSIALGNVALPSFFKRLGSSRIAILSSAYTASLYLGPAIATALTLPIKHLFSISWNEMSLAWIFIPVLSILLIVFFASNKSVSIENKTVVSNEGDERLERTINPWISIPCWIMAIYFAFLSFNFFIITAWFPELISSYGLSETKSAFYASLFPLIAIPFATLSSFYIYKIKQQKILFFINPIIVTTGILILVYGDNSLIPIAISIMGVGAGICTGIAFLLPLLRFNNTANVTKANAMMQSMGYLIAFCGPLVSGYAHDFTGSWTIVLWICALTLFIQSVLGIAIGKNEKFDQDELES